MDCQRSDRLDWIAGGIVIGTLKAKPSRNIACSHNNTDRVLIL
jgi:hypothetical protein